MGRTQGLQITRAWVSSCPGPWQLLWCPGHHPPPLGTAYACPGRRCSRRAALPLQEKLGASELLGLLAEEVAHALHSHIIGVENRSPEKGGVGGAQMQANQAVDGGSTSVE